MEVGILTSVCCMLKCTDAFSFILQYWKIMYEAIQDLLFGSHFFLLGIEILDGSKGYLDFTHLFLAAIQWFRRVFSCLVEKVYYRKLHADTWPVSVCNRSVLILQVWEVPCCRSTPHKWKWCWESVRSFDKSWTELCPTSRCYLPPFSYSYPIKMLCSC